MPDEKPEPLSQEDDSLDEIIAEYLTALQSGQCPDRQAFLGRFPHLAESLQAFFADQDHFAKLAAPLPQGLLGRLEQNPSPDPGATQDYSPPAFGGGPDEALFGDYELFEELARGGMGVIYRARQISLNRPVALKMILAGRLASPQEVERFRREAEIAAQLDHPHIVPIYEVGEQAGHHFFSMKLVEEGDLTQHLSRFFSDHRGAARLVAEIADAVHHAHQHGLLHRDLKPRNILVDSSNHPQVTDFGLAKRVRADSGLTEAGAIVGTASYMAPEQARGEPSLTTAVDVYSLGAILYEILTGRPPFQGATAPEVFQRVLNGEPDRPRSLQPRLARDLETICLKCLEKDPGRRYGSAAALAEDLRAWLESRPIYARPIGPVGRWWRWCRRNPLAAAGGTSIVVLVALFSYGLWNENRETREALRGQEKALMESRQARNQARDHLVRSLRDQAHALAVAPGPGSRFKILELLGQAEELRRRQREIEPPSSEAEEPGQLPSQSDLRSEGVMALLLSDLRPAGSSLIVEGSQPGLSPSGQLAAVLTGNAVVVYDLNPFRERGRWPQKDMLGTALALDSSGRRLASWSATAPALTLWDLPSGTRERILAWPRHLQANGTEEPQPAQLVSSDMAWSPNGTYLAAIDRRPGDPGRQELFLWDLSSPQGPQSLAKVPADYDRGGACFSGAGNLLAYPIGEKIIGLWQPAAARKVADVEMPLPVVGRLALDPTGQRLASPCAGTDGRGGAILIWDCTGNREIMRLRSDSDLRGAVLGFHPSGKYLALGTRDGHLALFELVTGRHLIDLPAAHPFGTTLLSWRADGKGLVTWGVLEGALRCWEFGQSLATEVSTSSRIRDFTVSGDRRWLAVSDARDGLVRVHDCTSGRRHCELVGSASSTRNLLVFSPENKQLAAIDSYRALVWDVETGNFLARLEQDSGLEGLITSVVYTSQGKLLACVSSARPPCITVWDVVRPRAVWRSPPELLADTAYLVPPGHQVASIVNPTLNRPARLTLHDLVSAEEAAIFDLAGLPLDGRSFSSDGQWLATLRAPEGISPSSLLGLPVSAWTKADLVLHRLPEGKEKVVIAGDSISCSCAFSPDSQLLAVGYRDGVVRLYRISQRENIFHCRFGTRPISGLAFVGEGTMAVTDGEGTVKFVDLQALRRELGEQGLGW